MEIKINHFTYEKNARYCTLGSLSSQTKNIWIVCHGYGQLATTFIKKFLPILDEENYFIAPEGMHRYYLDQEHQKVGASWMTREDRENDIQDYIRMLDKMMSIEFKNFKGNIILLGFSQGVATVSRWYMMGKIKPTHFIMWAGVFPPDLPLEKENYEFKSSKNYMVIGTQDQFFNDNRKELMMNEIRAKNIDFELIEFDGKHVLNISTLVDIKNKI